MTELKITKKLDIWGFLGIMAFVGGRSHWHNTRGKDMTQTNQTNLTANAVAVESAIGNRQSAIGNRQSAIGNRQSAIGKSRQSRKANFGHLTRRKNTPTFAPPILSLPPKARTCQPKALFCDSANAPITLIPICALRLPSGVCSCISAFLTAANSLNVSCAFCDRILSKAENNSICFLR